MGTLVGTLGGTAEGTKRTGALSSCMATTPDDVLVRLASLTDPVESPVSTAPEVAEGLPLSRRAVLDRLRILEARGDVGSKSVGAHATVWWPLPSSVPSKDPTTEATREFSVSEETDVVAAHADGLADVLPGSGEKLSARMGAVEACVAYLREQGVAQRSDFIRNVYPAHVAEFGSEGGWWNAIGKEGLGFLAEQDSRIVAPGDTRSPWEWQNS